MTCFSFRVFGEPAPKGSYSALHTKNGRAYLIPASKKEHPWRERVRLTALNEIRLTHEHIPLDCGLTISMIFYLPRPKSVTKNKRPHPTVKPDIDKLLRSTNDALTDSGIIADDARILEITGKKKYADDRQPGAYITITDQKDTQ